MTPALSAAALAELAAIGDRTLRGEEENALRLAAIHLDRLDLGLLRTEGASERVAEALDRVLARARALR